MLIPYNVTATDLGTAITIAQRRAIADGFTHTSVQSTRQVGPMTWEIVMFVAQSGALTRR